MSQAVPVEKIDSRIREIDVEIIQTEERLRELNNQMTLLASLKQMAVDVPTCKQHVGDEAKQSSDDRSKPTTRVISDYVTGNPGRTTDAIATAVIGDISTNSNNPRRLILSTITNMVRNGVLAKENDRIYLAGRAPLPDGGLLQ